MSTEKNKHIQFKQLNSNDRLELNECLNRGLNLTDTSRVLNCTISTVKKEIDRTKELKIYHNKNICGFKSQCTNQSICGNTKCVTLCKNCARRDTNCNYLCTQFTNKPQCKMLKKHSGVCNGCGGFKDCKLNKWFYYPIKADEIHKDNMKMARFGAKITHEDALALADFLKPFMKKNLSLDSIKSQFCSEAPYSVQTLYTWINNGVYLV